MKKGKFVIIEGTDGGGKATQLQLLADYCLKEGIRIKTDDYPHYESTPWGKLIGRMIIGEFGNPLSLSPYLTVLPYMIDEYFGGLKIKKWLGEGYYVLSNRYFTSNVHQVAKLSGRKKGKFRDWLWRTGWEEMGILKPDLVLVLLVDPKWGMRLAGRKASRSYTKGRKRDKVERDYPHQKAAFDEYLRMCKTNKWWKKLNCMYRRGKLMTPEAVHRKIVKFLREEKLL